MKHLLCHTVYSDVYDLSPYIGDDGIELLTDYDPVPEPFLGCEAVHLPYAIDWYGRWTGDRDITDDVRPDMVKFIYYGKDREDMIENVRRSIEAASAIGPAYGVMHACSANFDELYEREYSDKDIDVVSALCEMVNSAVSGFKGGEPPFRIAFENLWWPGLRMLDASGFRYLEQHLEFDNWGLCLDTGHLLVATKQSSSQKRAIEILHEKVDSYPKDMLDRIIAMHLHVNTSADYIASYTPDKDLKSKGHMARYSSAYRHVTSMDQHLPFTDKGITEVVERISPEYVNHEMGAVGIEEKVRDYRIQRALFS